MESEWVRIMPFIERPLPMTAVNTNYPGVSESKEIYEYFKGLNPKTPIDEFKTFYFSLPPVPRLGQTRLEQIMEAVRIRKLADKVHAQMDEMGIKILPRVEATKEAVVEAKSGVSNPSPSQLKTVPK